jgi:hypothetical protein
MKSIYFIGFNRLKISKLRKLSNSKKIKKERKRKDFSATWKRYQGITLGYYIVDGSVLMTLHKA